MSIQSTSAAGTLPRIKAGPHRFTGMLERELAPRTCAAFETLLPFTGQIIHLRWSGRATWLYRSAIWTSVLSLRTPPATLHRARCCDIPASARPSCCFPMAAVGLPASSASWPATTS